jgi:hypothetical protein
MIFQVEHHPHYNHLTATVAQGLRKLGHRIYSQVRYEASYVASSDLKQRSDAFIQFLPDGMPNPRSNFNIMVVGEDNGNGFSIHEGMLESTGFDMAFVRDLTETREPHVYPIQFGIEDRYYDATWMRRSPLRDRPIDITFLGRYDTPMREAAVAMIENEFGDLALNVGQRIHEIPDALLSRWVYGFCVHDPAYFRDLSQSKINLSFHGWGYDCARHWEVMASGGVPVIERLPYDIPHLDESNCVFFTGLGELRDVLSRITAYPQEFQGIATKAFDDGKKYHTTRSRAEYMMLKIKEVMDAKGTR